jgi:hypothetical protein
MIIIFLGMNRCPVEFTVSYFFVAGLWRLNKVKNILGTTLKPMR